MSDTVIRVENLSKKYIIGHQKRERYTALRDVLADRVKSLGHQVLKPFGKNIPDSDVEEFWALKDVSFEVNQGDRIGIIGRNGAGKSTLLKILSRITEPTTGRISIKGRVASLLEVGTGFHPELTGRENIYLNGAILGMSKAEIKKKFDEIVAFAEVERFLDTPVKRYSSGMYVRLAFGVAAHLQTDILLIDEVLAVGDAAFQKKCIGKMQDVSQYGRTLMFISHEIGNIKALCQQGILLNKGYCGGILNIDKAILDYQSLQPTHKQATFTNAGEFIKKVVLQRKDGTPSTNYFFGEKLLLEIELAEITHHKYGINIILRNAYSELVSLFSTNPHDGIELPIKPCMTICFQLPSLRYSPGEYEVEVMLTEPAVKIVESTGSMIKFEIHPQPLYGTWAYDKRFGAYFSNHSWKIEDTVYER